MNPEPWWRSPLLFTATTKQLRATEDVVISLFSLHPFSLRFTETSSSAVRPERHNQIPNPTKPHLQLANQTTVKHYTHNNDAIFILPSINRVMYTCICASSDNIISFPKKYRAASKITQTVFRKCLGVLLVGSFLGNDHSTSTSLLPVGLCQWNCQRCDCCLETKQR